jgi:mannose-6-phosphate isomerase-like protein (cupin superfamily)
MRFDLQTLAGEHALEEERYRELLRASDLSVGLYHLSRGAEDLQKPHTEDELYYGLSGRARLRVGAVDHEISPGTLVFVAARDPHHFHSIEEDLTVLVVFGPAEGSRETPKS